MIDLKLIQKYLQKLGLSDEAVVLYAQLVQEGYSTALALSKKTGITRTQVYRLLEELQNFGLVSAEQLSYGSLYRPLPADNLEGALASKEAEIAAVKRQLPNITSFFTSLAGAANEDQKAKVQHYYGASGVKQVTWNTLRAKDKFCVFEVAHVSAFTDKAFTRHYREEVIKRGIQTFDLTNDTEARLKELEPIDTRSAQLRHVSKDILDIQFEVLIYNDVVALLDYRNAEPFALEIHHESLRIMLQQLFDVVWSQAQPLKIR